MQHRSLVSAAHQRVALMLKRFDVEHMEDMERQRCRCSEAVQGLTVARGAGEKPAFLNRNPMQTKDACSLTLLQLCHPESQGFHERSLLRTPRCLRQHEGLSGMLHRVRFEESRKR